MRGAAALALGIAVMAHEAKAAPPPGFLDVPALTDALVLDIRYATANNFTGKPVPGYGASRCWLRSEAAQALARAAGEFRRLGYGLVAYDCYRPQRAVDAFVAWAKDINDQSTKVEFYPGIEKSALLGPYIGAKSQHSAGVAVDVGLLGKDGAPLDFGTPFDFFGPASATKNAATPEIRRHRQLLVRVMKKHGFVNYPGEWWHFSFPLADVERIDAPIE